MNVTLKPEHEAFIRGQVESGKYEDAEHVVDQAIRLLQDHEKLLYMRATIAEAEAEVARGEFVEWTPDFWDKLQEEADEADRLGRPISSDVLP